MADPRIAIVVLTWNRVEDTLECLASLDGLDDPNFQTIVVDNGSTDRSVEVVRERYPQVVVVENHKNLGFAEGNNVGIRHALANGAEYMLLLNNDAVVDSALLRELRAAQLQLPEAG